MGYAELHAYSCFSFHRGAARVEELFEEGGRLGLAGLAITDRDGLYSAVRSHLSARKLHESGRAAPRPIYGAELGLCAGGRLVALVQNGAGWRNLSALISESKTACEKGGGLLPVERIAERSEGLVVLTGGRFGPVDRLLLGLDIRRSWKGLRPKGPWGEELGSRGLGEPRRLSRRLDEVAAWRAGLDPLVSLSERREFARDCLVSLRNLFGEKLYVEVSNHGLPEDDWLRQELYSLSADLGLPRVATNLVHYARPEQRPLQDVLSCIRLHTRLDEAGTSLLPNAHFHLKSPETMARLFEDDPEAIQNSLRIANSCRFGLDDLPYSFPVYPVPEEHSLQSYLEEVTWQGAVLRYGHRLDTDPRIRAQVQHELDVIGRMGLAGYFLIVWDISQECIRRGILSQGRGSAANSCVCYCLQITAVDPISLDLLFERFLSEARGGYPDIDLDISNSMREEILQFVYEKYGRAHAAMVCNVITYHPRSAIRDVGKVFGLGEDQVGRMAKSLGHYSRSGDLKELFGEGGEEAIDADAERLHQVVDFTTKLCGLPRHIGIHSGGIVISGTPLSEACPIENASMPDRTVLQWDKDDIAHMGLVKIDLLALGMLSVIQEATRLLARRGVHFEMAQLTQDDPEVYDRICAADTVGLFQIESRAQMNTLPRLRPRTFHDLVVEVALIRPGPIQGDMVHPYIRRRQGREPITYAHPSLEPILKRTLGIPLFQEQAMKMAITLAGFSPGEADRLRKVMGFKRASTELEEMMDKMLQGMKAGGISDGIARRIREQLRGFAAYGFPESHAASFALIVYASAWLKHHQPAAFYAALLNSQPMGFYSPATLIGDARRHGLEILPVCVNDSEQGWTIWAERSLRAGLQQLRGFGADEGAAIEEERRARGLFRSVEDFCDRMLFDRGKLRRLAEAGAFDCFALTRRQALWTVRGWRKRLPLEGAASLSTSPLFPRLTSGQLNLWDHAVAGFSPKLHPLAEIRGELHRRGYLSSQELTTRSDGEQVSVAGIVITRQLPQTAKGTFFITMEDEQGFTNIIVHKSLYERHRRLLRRARFLACVGGLQRRDGVTNLLASGFRDLEPEGLLDTSSSRGGLGSKSLTTSPGLGSRSRDFR